MSKSVKPAARSALPSGDAAKAPQLRAFAQAAATLSLAGLLSWTPQMAQAESLTELYQAARSYDAAYLSAKAQAESVQYQVQQVMALLRPTLGFKASVNRSHFDASQTPNSDFQYLYKSDSYNSNTTTKTLGLAGKMPLINKSDAIKVDQAELQLVTSQADLNIAENDLIARLAQAYFDVLSAQDVLGTTQANKKALTEQLASAKRNFEVGNATITDTREAQARFDLAAAQEIAATNDLQVKRIALDQLVGRADVKPNPLAKSANLDQLASGQMDEWVSKTTTAPAVRKAEAGLRIAQMEIDKAKAGHWPTLDAVGSVTNNKFTSNSVTTQANSGTTSTLGLELNLPLYAGNSIQNRIKEVLLLSDKAERDVDNARRTVALTTRQVFAGVQSGQAQVKALEAAEASAKLALEATQLGYRVGVRINKDVLDAQTSLSSTQKDLYKARYDVIVGSIKLKQAAGTLTADDLAELNKLVQP